MTASSSDSSCPMRHALAVLDNVRPGHSPKCCGGCMLSHQGQTSAMKSPTLSCGACCVRCKWLLHQVHSLGRRYDIGSNRCELSAIARPAAFCTWYHAAILFTPHTFSQQAASQALMQRLPVCTQPPP